MLWQQWMPDPREYIDEMYAPCCILQGNPEIRDNCGRDANMGDERADITMTEVASDHPDPTADKPGRTSTDKRKSRGKEIV